jgi:hypothetical protein
MSEENQITQVTRQRIFDELRLSNVEWAGRMDEDKFLSRTFDLTALRSNDRRCNTMLGDVNRHRVAWGKVDWEHDWVYDDDRLNLMHRPDDVLLTFLCEMVHPLVRSDEAEAASLVVVFNRHLARDGFEIAPVQFVSGRPIYAGRATLGGLSQRVDDARRVADEFGSSVIAAQITRMEASIQTDPALAIGSAKEFVETFCKGVLTQTGQPPSGREDLPKLVHLARQALRLDADKTTEETLRRTLSSLATLTQGIAELRGQLGTGHGPDPSTPAPSTHVARFAVNLAVALGVFLFETFQAQQRAP